MATAGYATVELDGASWIHDVVAERALDAIVCLDTFHVIGWATTALDEVRRGEWNKLRQAGAAKAAKQLKGLRFLLRRNWEHLTMGQREIITALEGANRRTFRTGRASVKLARTVRDYRASIEATIEWKLTNGIAESNNASIGRVRVNARASTTLKRSP